MLWTENSLKITWWQAQINEWDYISRLNSIYNVTILVSYRIVSRGISPILMVTLCDKHIMIINFSINLMLIPGIFTNTQSFLLFSFFDRFYCVAGTGTANFEPGHIEHWHRFDFSNPFLSFVKRFGWLEVETKKNKTNKLVNSKTHGVSVSVSVPQPVLQH